MNPRNDPVLLARQYDECECPTWWGCESRGCHEQAKRNYADPKNHRARWETDQNGEYDMDPTGARGTLKPGS